MPHSEKNSESRIFLQQMTWITGSSRRPGYVSLARTPSAPAWNASLRRKRKTPCPERVQSLARPTAPNTTTRVERAQWLTPPRTSREIVCQTWGSLHLSVTITIAHLSRCGLHRSMTTDSDNDDDDEDDRDGVTGDVIDDVIDDDALCLLMVFVCARAFVWQWFIGEAKFVHGSSRTSIEAPTRCVHLHVFVADVLMFFVADIVVVMRWKNTISWLVYGWFVKKKMVQITSVKLQKNARMVKDTVKLNAQVMNSLKLWKQLNTSWNWNDLE